MGINNFYWLTTIAHENLMKLQYKARWAWTLWCYSKKRTMKCYYDEKALGIFGSANGTNDSCICGILIVNLVCI